MVTGNLIHQSERGWLRGNGTPVSILSRCKEHDGDGPLPRAGRDEHQRWDNSAVEMM